jgi:hypothetical protein
VFGIEDFCGKLNGNGTLHELLHLNIPAGERRSFCWVHEPARPATKNPPLTRRKSSPPLDRFLH